MEVDNVVLPKYIIKYDLSDINKIKLISFHEIPFSIGPNGGIKKVILNNGLLIYIASSLSSYTPRVGTSVRVLKLRNFACGFHLRKYYEDYWSDDYWNDIAAVQNAVYRVSSNRLFKLKIEENYFTQNTPVDNDLLEQVWETDEGKIIGFCASEDKSALIIIIGQIKMK